jgi:integrase
LRVVALLLFAGIRPDAEAGEISRLQWEAVGETEIYVSPEVSKVGDRHVPITPRLRRLLRGHPKSGSVVPAGWRRAWQRIRRVSGISEMQDVCRHTFASNHLAAFGEDATKQAMGHTAGSSTLFRHYRRAITRESAGGASKKSCSHTENVSATASPIAVARAHLGAEPAAAVVA